MGGLRSCVVACGLGIARGVVMWERESEGPPPRWALDRRQRLPVRRWVCFHAGRWRRWLVDVGSQSQD